MNSETIFEFTTISTREWRGYWVSTVGRDEAAVRRYLQQQERGDQRLEQLRLFGGAGRLERLQD